MKSKVVGTGADQGTRSRWANNFLPQTKHKANKSLKIEAKLNFNSVEPFFYQKLMETIQNVSQYNCIKSLFLYFVEDIMKRKFYVISMTEHWKKLEVFTWSANKLRLLRLDYCVNSGVDCIASWMFNTDRKYIACLSFIEKITLKNHSTALSCFASQSKGINFGDKLLVKRQIIHNKRQFGNN